MLHSSGFLTDNKNRHSGFIARPTEAHWARNFPDRPYVRFSVESMSEDKPLILRGVPSMTIQSKSGMRLWDDYYMYCVAFEVKKVLYMETVCSFVGLFETEVDHLYFPEFRLSSTGQRLRDGGVDAVIGACYYDDFIEGGMRFPRLLLLNPKKSVVDIRT